MAPESSPLPGPLPAPSSRGEGVPDTPEQSVESLLRAAPELSAEQRAAFAEKLKGAGLAVTDGGSAGALELPPELQKALGLQPGQPLNPERAVKLLSELTQLVFTLDQLVWNLWKQLAPRSMVRREAGTANDLKLMTCRYLVGDTEVSTQQLKQLLDHSRKLTAGLLMAIGGVGRNYGKKYLERFSPDVIRDLAEMTKGWAALEKKCWDKFVELHNEFATEPAIEKEIQDAIARFAEEVMRGRYANPNS